MAESLFSHLRQQGSRHGYGAEEVGVELFAEFPVGNVLGESWHGETGVVY